MGFYNAKGLGVRVAGLGAALQSRITTQHLGISAGGLSGKKPDQVSTGSKVCRMQETLNRKPKPWAFGLRPSGVRIQGFGFRVHGCVQGVGLSVSDVTHTNEKLPPEIYELWSKLLVSPFIHPKILPHRPHRIPHIHPFKELRP